MPVMYAGVQLEAGAAPVTVESSGRWLISFVISETAGMPRRRTIEVSSASSGSRPYRDSLASQGG